MAVRKIGTTFNKIYPEAFTLQICLVVDQKIPRVETPESLNQGWFKSEVT